ncbi:MAG: polysaccharide deacetylase family protein [Bacteroidetes bacterium]|nr:polysaccharide deacetylase family protein [Bacteroidota bacterium]
MFYFIKTPWILKKIYAKCIWNMPREKKIIYLTFDDGPHPVATPFILDELKKYSAKATFFCIGKNVVEHHDLYRRIIAEGHRVGNHTHHHLNGWKTTDQKYFDDIRQAAKYIDSNLYRPPYGRISHFQINNLKNSLGYHIVMWDVLSADFDRNINGDRCAINVIANTKPGSIVIFHDSEKAYDRMRVALPKVLGHFSEQGYNFEAIH